MGTYRVYHLTFKTQLHLGRPSGPAQAGNLGLEKTETYIPADTLFSALCQTWVMFYGAESLTSFLSGYSSGPPTLPFTLTSAFPFAQDVHLFPKPLLNFLAKPDNKADDKTKKSKRVQFISESVFQDVISGNPPEFNEKELINGEKVWMSPEERERLGISDEGFDIWKTDTRPRVTIGSQNSGSEIWHVQTVQFNRNCGLWFAAAFDSEETQQKVEALLRVLGDNGIGGERNAGYGLFDFEEVTFEVPSLEEADRFVTLSPICPNSAEQLAELLEGEVAYSLNLLSGWVSTAGSAARRKHVNMFAEGSVLHTSGTHIGRLVDLSPDDWEHPVYRYGYAWPVGMKGASE